MAIVKTLVAETKVTESILGLQESSLPEFKAQNDKLIIS